MAVIPTQREQTAVPDAALPYDQVRSTPSDFGADLATSVQQAGDTAADIALKRQQIANETSRVNAENDLMARTQDLLNGNADKKITGYRTLVGQNAIDALPDYQQQLQEAYKDVRSGLNPAVQRIFDQTAFRIVRGTGDSMGSYGAQQQVVAAHETARANVALSQSGALTFADDPGGWEAHLGAVQEASLAGSRTLGLTPEAAELQRQRDVSKVFEDRTKQLMLRDPGSAADFYSKNIGAIVPEQRYELERALKVSGDAQFSRTDADTAYQAAIGRASDSPSPKDFSAPDVKPYDDKRIAQVAAFVKGPSPYDADIAAAAKQYGVSATEIKLKIAIESGGDEKAVNPTTGATGIGQFMPETARRLGINPSDPKQSIDGIAKYLASNGGGVGGDVSGADRAYYSGRANGSGPNTNQYVENTRAVRQALVGDGAPAPLTAADLRGQEGAVIQAAQAAAAERRPGDMVYRDEVVSAAHSKWARDVQALEGQDYQNMSQVMGAVIKGKITSLSDLPPDQQQTLSRLTPQGLEAVDSLTRRNLAEVNGEYTRSDPGVVNSLRARIYLPDGDPQRITNPGQLAAYVPGQGGKGGLNHTDFEHLTQEISQANTPEGNPFLKQANGVKETARKMLMTSLDSNTLAHPELAEEGAYRFAHDLDAQVAAMRGAKKDPKTLFDPTSPDYVLAPGRVQRYAPTESEIVAAKAARGAPANPAQGSVVAARPSAPKPQRLAGETPADYLKRIGEL